MPVPLEPMVWAGKTIYPPQVLLEAQGTDRQYADFYPTFIELTSHPDRPAFGWQLWVGAQMCLRRGGEWAAKHAALCVPRQNGKGDTLEDRVLFEALMFPKAKIMHTAHQGETADEAWERMVDRVTTVPSLAKRVASVSRVNGKRDVRFLNGSQIKYRTRSEKNMRGFGHRLIVIDEAMYFLHEMAGGLIPTGSAQSEQQFVYAFTGLFAGSDYMHDIRAKVLQGQALPRWAWFEWTLPDRADGNDPAWWAAVNPSMADGLIKMGTVQDEFDNLQSTKFMRERLNVHEFPQEAGAAIPITAWRACTDVESFPGPEIHLGVFVNKDQSRSWVVAASERADGVVHVELAVAGDGTDWLAGWLAETIHDWTDVQPVVWLSDRTNTAVVLPELKRAKVAFKSVG
ncbi:hypothetical protein, partial [Stomatohabitans albus]|uniref:hypothetical protein n=1 Tax=Stomatohabitans albus TaxID=3110766 RepID=UPI00300C3AAA